MWVFILIPAAIAFVLFLVGAANASRNKTDPRKTPFSGTPAGRYYGAGQELGQMIKSAQKVCPQCAEKVKTEAQVCRFCSFRFADSAGGVPVFYASAPAAAPGSTVLTSCPDCGGKVSRRASACPHCGRPVRVDGSRTCKDCGGSVPAGTAACPGCGCPAETVG